MRGNWVGWAFVFMTGMLNCAGSLMLKQSRLNGGEPGLVPLLLSPWFIGGLCFYGLSVLCFATALEKLPVSIAYPSQTGFGFTLVILAAWWLFREQLTGNQYLGLAAIAFGIFMLARS